MVKTEFKDEFISSSDEPTTAAKDDESFERKVTNSCCNTDMLASDPLAPSILTLKDEPKLLPCSNNKTGNCLEGTVWVDTGGVTQTCENESTIHAAGCKGEFEPKNPLGNFSTVTPSQPEGGLILPDLLLECTVDGVKSEDDLKLSLQEEEDELVKEEEFVNEDLNTVIEDDELRNKEKERFVFSISNGSFLTHFVGTSQDPFAREVSAESLHAELYVNPGLEDGDTVDPIGVETVASSNSLSSKSSHVLNDDLVTTSSETESDSRHLTEQHGKERISCTLCSKTFASWASFQKHCTAHHEGKPYSCSTCDKSFDLLSAFKKHMKNHKPFQCTKCRKSFWYEKAFQKHMTSDHTEQFPCSVCNRSFPRKSSLQNHLLAHAGKLPFVCSVCQKSFDSSYKLKNHEVSHSGVKPFSCTVCSKTFAYESSLKEHNLVHTVGRRFPCSVCKKTFVSSKSLLKHVATHSENKSFFCDTCNKGFSEHAHLREHVRFHTGEKPFSCSVCDKSFFTKSSLRRHGGVHTGVKKFRCSVCQKSFSSSTNLQQHLRSHTHSGEKPFSCTYCHKVFALKSSLKIHSRHHTKENLRHCTHCAKAFTTNQKLKRHIRSIHSGEKCG
jgi:KRAB domain-containing zinc finger protein